jgi:hemerythrin-like domain-containing protein
MTNVHNALIRGLNAIYLQCTHVHSETDIHDFAFFVQAWGDSVHHHHHSEETAFFPAFEKIAKESGATEEVMKENVEQHHRFDPGLTKTIDYVKDVLEKKQEYDSAKLKAMIDDFAPALIEHLGDEIKTLLALEPYDGPKMRKSYDEIIKIATKGADTVSIQDVFCKTTLTAL